MALSPINLSDVDAGTGGFVIIGQVSGDRTGRSVASAGDINGDGFDDLIVASYSAQSPNGTNAGRSYVIFGQAAGFGGTVDLTADADGTGGFVKDERGAVVLSKLETGTLQELAAATA